MMDPTRKGCALLGSGTDVGKTWVGVRLFEELRTHVPNLRGIKPFESGWNAATSDARAWKTAQLDAFSTDELCRWQLPRPVTPAEEFERLGTTPTVGEVKRAVDQMVGKHPFLLETAGGVASPITRHLDSVDIVNALGIPAILIVSNGLGTISATTTAFSYAASKGVRPRAVVVNVRPEDDDPSASSNMKWIQRQVDAPVFAYNGSFPNELVSLVIEVLRDTTTLARS